MSALGVVSYGLCALSFGFLAALLTTSWRGGVQGALLATASAAMAIWAGMAAWYAWSEAIPALWMELAEIARTGLWLVFLVWLMGEMRRRSHVLRVFSGVVLAAPAVALVLVAWIHLTQSVVPDPIYASTHPDIAGAGLVLALLGLMLVEQLYRNLPGERRWAMKFLCLGLGVVFVYDLYLYSDALLFRQINPALWFARGAVESLAAPLIAVAAARNRSWSLPVFVSRHVAFHTAALMAAGIYLLVISAGGYYIRDFGGDWGEFAQIVLVAAGAVGLLVFLLSGSLRARLRVFLSKHFFHNKYDYREEWLQLTSRLAENDGSQSPGERAIRASAEIFGSPGGAVWLLRDDSGFVPVATWRLGVAADATVAEDAPLAAFLRQRRWIVDMDEYRRDPAMYGELTLPAAVEERANAWAIIPLLLQDRLTGFLLLNRPEINAEITWEDRDLMKTIGRQLASYLGQHEDAQALSQARQFEAFNQLTAFLMHDLKNLIAQQSMVVRNAEKHRHNPAFIDDAMATIGHSVERMERLLEHLHRHRHGGITERVDVHRVLTEAAHRCADREPAPGLSLEAPGRVIETDPDAFAMVLVHLIRNAQDATARDGRVTVSAQRRDDGVEIRVEDTGTGMSPEFVRDELFRPFRTTKSSKGMGIGAHQARDFVQRHGGRVTVHSEVGRGTRISFTLPSRPADERESEPETRTIMQTGES